MPIQLKLTSKASLPKYWSTMNIECVHRSLFDKQMNPLLFISTLFLFAFLLMSSVALGAIYTANSCSYSDVNNKVANASPGDTVYVPAGTCTWTNELTKIDQISLIGAGIGTTTITTGFNGQVISIVPTANTYISRVSGFTFNLNNKSSSGNGVGVNIYNNGHIPVMYNIRIDHNRFANSNDSGAAIQNWSAYGVIDNNIFENVWYPLRIGWGDNGGKFNWDNFYPLVWGAAHDSMYFEDNTVTFPSLSGYGGILTDGGEGGRYVIRYNDFTNKQAGIDMMLDLHNWQGDYDHATMGGEVYGNDNNWGTRSGDFMKWRGGSYLEMYNNITTSGSTPGTQLYNNNGACPSGFYKVELHNNGALFNNYKNFNGALISPYVTEEYCGKIAANEEYWTDNTNQTGSTQTVGVRCGPDRETVTTCTENVFFWETAQSCSDLTGLVGVNPSSPITGTLYRCNGSNAWVPYYTPYTYPHPLRSGQSGNDTVSPDPPFDLNTF